MLFFLLRSIWGFFLSSYGLLHIYIYIQILVGPSDWEDYTLGKEGAERYRVYNLPKDSGPGVYELGIAVSRTGLGREIGKLDPERIVVVYLGQADSVRTRLQRYGRSGAHLGNSYSTGFPNDCKTALQKGPGLFEEILLRGYPIVFRWAPVSIFLILSFVFSEWIEL